MSLRGIAGTAKIAQNLNISPTDIESLVRAAKDHKIDLTVVGPGGASGGGHYRPVSHPGFSNLRPDEKSRRD